MTNIIHLIEWQRGQFGRYYSASVSISDCAESP